MLDLTTQQRSAVQSGEPVLCTLDQIECIVIRKDVFERLQQNAYDDSEWTPEEMLAIAARTFDEADRGAAIR
jgi:hypothetical protein